VQTAVGGAVVWQIDALCHELAALGMSWYPPHPKVASER